MPLSDHEQKLLDEIEQALYAEDPKFAAHVRSSRRRSNRRRDAVLCVVGALVGLGLVLVGLVTTVIAVSVVGFVLIVGSAGWAGQLMKSRSGASSAPSGRTGGAAGSARSSGGLRSRMEDRLRRRFEQE